MKLLISLMIAISTLLGAMALPAQAQFDTVFKDVGIESGIATSTGAPKQNVTQIIGNVISVILGLLGVVILVFMIYGGIMWMTAGGNDERVKKAQQIITNSVIGLVIALAAFSISAFVVDQLSDATGTAETPGVTCTPPTC